MIALASGALLWLAGKTKIPAGLIAGGLILAVVLVAWLGWKSVRNGIWQEGFAVCTAQWTEKALESKIARLERELEAARRSKESDDRNDAELEAERDAWKKKVDDYETERKKRGDYCPLGDDAIGLR